jgi:signal transduction histidine kinase
MNNLVEELLDCSREMKLNRTRFTLSENLSESVAVVQGFLDKKQIEVKMALSEGNIQLNADPARIKQVMLNLLKNAADATPQGGTVVLSSLQDATMVSISVKDSGRGIPDEDMDKIFDLFYTTKKHGTGQGLYICRKIIEAHGGRLTVENDASGACFTICLPREGMEG